MHGAAEKTIVLLCGYTKCRKSTFSRIFAELLDCELVEMSEPFRSSIQHIPREALTLDFLLSELARYRAQAGETALADSAIRRINASAAPVVILSGLRRHEDFQRLKTAFEQIYTVYIHTHTTLRHFRLDSDPTSIAKGPRDYALLDRIAYDEGIRFIVPEADFILVNEPGFPLTPLEQMRLICTDLKGRFGIQTKPTTKEIMMSEEGVILKILPVYHDDTHDGAREVISRIIKKKGELATICVEPMSYIAYIEFPPDGEPRANHFHEEKQEYLYLIKGKVKLLYRRAGQPDDEVKEVIVEGGTLVQMQPGYAHAYVTLEEGYGVEFSPTPYETIAKDKVRDYVVK